MKALIAGGGIGGLTTALFLNQAGIEVEVFERAGQIRELGVGINLLPHAARELAALGLLDELDAHAIRTRELIYCNRLGQVIWHEARGLDAGLDYPQFSIHRGRLLGLIHRAVIDRLGPQRIHTGWRIDDLTQSADSVDIDLTGPNGVRGQARGDLLVGADGIHSIVRARLHPGEGPPIWNGVMLWRGCTRWPAWRDGRTMMIAGGNDAKFVFYPIERLADAPTLRLSNWAVMARIAGAGSAPKRAEDWSRLGQLDEVLPFVRDHFRLDALDPPAVIAATDRFYEYPNCDRDPLPRWSFGRVTLLGDAAHPMYPVGSNGASQAIIDARALAGHLAGAASLPSALEAYDAARRPPTSVIVLANRRGGPEGVIDLAEARAPEGFDAIDDIIPYREREAIVRGYARMAGFPSR